MVFLSRGAQRPREAVWVQTKKLGRYHDHQHPETRLDLAISPPCSRTSCQPRCRYAPKSRFELLQIATMAPQRPVTEYQPKPAEIKKLDRYHNHLRPETRSDFAKSMSCSRTSCQSRCRFHIWIAKMDTERFNGTVSVKGLSMARNTGNSHVE